MKQEHIKAGDKAVPCSFAFNDTSMHAQSSASLFLGQFYTPTLHTDGRRRFEFYNAYFNRVYLKEVLCERASLFEIMFSRPDSRQDDLLSLFMCM